MRCLWGIRGHLLRLKGLMIDFERVRFCLEISRGLKTAGGKYDEVRLLWLNQAAMELRFNPYHDPTNGRFTSGAGGVGASSSNGGKSSFSRPTLTLTKSEYGKVVHSINEVYETRYKGKTESRILLADNDGYHYYLFEIKEYGTYNIYEKGDI